MTRKAKKVKKKIYKSLAWAITFHKPTYLEWLDLKTKLNSQDIVKAIFSFEHGEMGCRPHLQGYLVFTIRRGCIQYLNNKRIHVEAATGNLQHNIDYICGVKKEYELGNVLYLKNINLPIYYKPASVLKLNQLYTWQRKLWNIVQRHAHSRMILWIWCEKGCSGKTEIARLLKYVRGCLILGGKAADMRNGVKNFSDLTDSYPCINIIDINREDMSSTSYGGAEDIKNRVFTNTKYEVDGVTGAYHSHVIIFSNSPPQMNKLSEDRLAIFEIVKEDMICTKIYDKYKYDLNMDELTTRELIFRESYLGYDFFIKDKFISNAFKVFEFDKTRKAVTVSPSLAGYQ